MTTTYKDRPIDIEELEGATHDHDYWCDAFVVKAVWLDTNQEFTDEELDEMNSGDIDEYIIAWLY